MYWLKTHKTRGASMSYLIEGSTGAGKTWYVRRAAYLACERNIAFPNIDDHIESATDTEVSTFLSSSRCMYFQVNATTTWDDLVSTNTFCIPSQTRENRTLSKPLVEFLERASHSEDAHAIIFDDIDRANTDVFFGPLISALQNRAHPISTGPDHAITIPPNVFFFFTSACDYRAFDPPISFLRAMDIIKTLDCTDLPLQRVYGTPRLEKALNLSKKLMSRTNQVIRESQESDNVAQPSLFQLGAGYFIVATNQPVQNILDDIHYKFNYLVRPLLTNCWKEGILTGDPTDILSSLNSQTAGEIEAKERISSVDKIAVKTGDEFPAWGPSEASTFLRNEVHENEKQAGRFKPRDAMECIIDTMLGNGLLPLDYIFDELLNNQEVGWVENEERPGERAAYLLEEKAAESFVYLTPKENEKTPHAFFSRGKTSGWHSSDGPAAYRFTYSDRSDPKIYLPLNGFRKKSMKIDTSKLSDNGNAAVAYRSCYRLVDAYLRLLESSYRSLADSKPEYADLANYVLIELNYHKGLHKELGKTKGNESTKFLQYCKYLLNLRSLWTPTLGAITINNGLFQRLTGNEVTCTDFDNLHESGNLPSTICFREVRLMTQSANYQAIMDRLNIRQLIFQGPPGTSKTFESKRFVLSQLNPELPCLKSTHPDRETIECELSEFKLNSTDYSDPCNSLAVDRGGWDIVQFHPAYSYEDFIRGIQVSAHNGQPTYETVNRIFGNIAELAKVAYDRHKDGNVPKFYLLVDEINRADLASVFGELIYGLEYRNSKLTTPYAVRSKSQGESSFEIEVTNNIYLIGTMNTADKSIGAMDYAIRRRFLFIDSPANRDVVVNSVQHGSNDEKDPIETVLFDAVQYLFNEDTTFNSDYHRNDVRIGHTFFLRTSTEDYAERMAERTAYQIVPILREYVRDGILYPIGMSDFQEAESSSPQSTNPRDLTSSIGQQLLFYATNMGEYYQGEIISENTVSTYVLDLNKALGD